MRFLSRCVPAALASAALFASACGGGGGGGSAANNTGSSSADATGVATVTLKNTAFRPSKTTVKTGQSVKWVWRDAPTQHDVVFPDYRSPLQAQGEFTQKFDTAGVFAYHCSIHPSMKGSVTVAG